ncbi:MurR/RpiR family transcriptional regulator [Vibrio sp. SS-MA-C1-2]|uniref:MurR/RpiR family transcriptional regulator n=1 Tax=Vibrio sp. SS-MA-C1-2 TaxID=2908646 RepID=UPI001F158AFC|nr:MurR/RpiR family transcriptional regulator [Vibrio sp. SS-MA-C1-2]UJF17912.1 MurR/RpiR family transcriptional regulator [Vibrio sp. SS-MA-C1-2]
MNSTNNILVRLRSNTESLSKKQRVVADYILENAIEVQFQTITDLARNTATSEATVVRLCRDIGYKGYPDFRMSLAVELSQKEQQKNKPLNDDVCHTSMQNAITSLQDTNKLIDKKAIDRVCIAIHKAKFISCVGVGASSVVGQYLTYRLTRIGKKSTMYSDNHLAVMNASCATKGDLWFAISSSGVTKEIIQVANSVEKKQAPVITISNISNSPLARLSTELLIAARPEGPLTGGAFSSKVGALLIVDIIINRLVKKYPQYDDSIQQTAKAIIPLVND